MSQERIALVTGANKGIGFEIARQLAEAGVRVFLGSRDTARGRTAADQLAEKGLKVQAIPLDLTNGASIEAAAAHIARQHDRLDILVNNAGIFDFSDGAPGKASIDAVRRVVEVNFIGALAVTQAVLPLLRAAPSGRIVNLASSLGSLTLNADPSSTYYAQRYIGYNASKAALNMLTIQLAQELRDTRVTAHSVSPGFVKTDLTGYGTMTPEEGARLPVHYALGDMPSGQFVEPDGATPW
jgi:NAD(P)-dependent dehydrogenase (short-subunit alcohol dehydrogenase family)